MLVEMPRTDGVEQPVLVPGNPVKLSGVAEGPETRVPWLGEHTDEVLAAELGLSAAELAKLRNGRRHRLSSDSVYRPGREASVAWAMPLSRTELRRPGCGGEPARGAVGRRATRCVVAAHGITGNHRSWQGVARALDDDVTLIAPDLRGRGRSADLPGPFGMRAHAADLVAVLDHLELDQAVLAGHSMGAYVAAVAATTDPDRWRRVVLVDGGVPLRCPTASTPTPCWPGSSARPWPGSR